MKPDNPNKENWAPLSKQRGTVRNVKDSSSDFLANQVCDLIGAAQGPRDLATNGDYLEGYGSHGPGPGKTADGPNPCP